MNKLEVNQVGGFPMTTRILDEIQKAHAIFNALGAIVGDNTIISGCTVVGSTVTDGVVYVNGEVFEFRGGIAQTKVKIVEVVENLVFQNNNSNPVIKTRYVTFGTGVDAINWVDFKRGFATKDIAEALALKGDKAVLDGLSDFVALMYAKLLTVDMYAEKNVQPDMAQTDDTKDDFIKNKGNYLEVLRSGTLAIGNPSGSSTLTVNFTPLLNTNYQIIPTLISLGDAGSDISVSYIIREKALGSFKVYVRESGNITQNVALDWTIIAKNQ